MQGRVSTGLRSRGTRPGRPWRFQCLNPPRLPSRPDPQNFASGPSLYPWPLVGLSFERRLTGPMGLKEPPKSFTLKITTPPSTYPMWSLVARTALEFASRKKKNVRLECSTWKNWERERAAIYKETLCRQCTD